MSVLRFAASDAKVLERPGKRSFQLVSTANAPGARATITRVIMEPGAVSPLHDHAHAEQIWLVEQGEAQLLDGGDSHVMLTEGDIVLTPAGQTHGIHNTGEGVFVYLTVTSPPEDMDKFYTVQPGASHR